MLMIGVITLLIALYTGLVIGTYKKFNQNGITFSGKLKLMFPAIPITLITLHFFWGIKAIFKGDKHSVYWFKMITIKYPIVIGMLIEIILENAAYKISENEKIIKMKKKRNRKKVIKKKKNLDLNMVPQYSSQKKMFIDYKNSLSNLAT